MRISKSGLRLTCARTRCAVFSLQDGGVFRTVELLGRVHRTGRPTHKRLGSVVCVRARTAEAHLDLRWLATAHAPLLICRRVPRACIALTRSACTPPRAEGCVGIGFKRGLDKWQGVRLAASCTCCICHRPLVAQSRRCVASMLIVCTPRAWVRYAFACAADGGGQEAAGERCGWAAAPASIPSMLSIPSIGISVIRARDCRSREGLPALREPNGLGMHAPVSLVFSRRTRRTFLKLL